MDTVAMVWLIGISLLAVGLTVYDKIAAKKAPRHRVRESVLLTVGGLGGALAMEMTMLLIRHKTRHPKFMVGLPIFIGAHIGLLIYFMVWREWVL